MVTTVSYGSRAGRWVLLATILASGIAQLDATVVNVALPRIGHDLHVGLTSLQWMVNAYTLTLSGLLLLGGSLGDRLGRRRIFVVGVVWFTAASLGCAVAPSAGVLIAMRAIQGVGGAMLTPGSLAILQAVFAPDDRAPAVGAWSGLTGVASAIGPVVGGLLVGVAPGGWRVVFLIIGYDAMMICTKQNRGFIAFMTRNMMFFNAPPIVEPTDTATWIIGAQLFKTRLFAAFVVER